MVIPILLIMKSEVASVPVNMKNIIANTFLVMAKQKPVDKITVKSLIEECGISRQTFYYHFQDIVEVIEWSLEQATEDMLERSLKAESPEEALAVLIAASGENSVLIRKLMNSQKREEIEKLFVQATRTYLQQMIQKKREFPLNYSDMEVALDFWSFGITGVLFQYCSQSQVEPKKLAEQICRLLPANLKTISE